MDHGHFAGAIQMWMRIGIARQTMSCPARMRDAERTNNRLFGDNLLQPRNAPNTFANLKLAVMRDAQTRRVIAAILQSPQSLEQERRGCCLAYIAYNAAHT